MSQSSNIERPSVCTSAETIEIVVVVVVVLEVESLMTIVLAVLNMNTSKKHIMSEDHGSYMLVLC